MSKTGWLVLTLLVGGFMINSHLDSKKRIIVQGYELRTGKRVEAEWGSLKQAVKDHYDIYYIDFGGATGEHEITVEEAYKGNKGNIIIRSDYPIDRAVYQFNKKDVLYVYRVK